MAKVKDQRSFDEVLEQLKQRGFDVIEAPGTPGRVFVKKYGCSAAIEKNLQVAATDPSEARLFVKPGFLLGGEIARLVDKGYQKFLANSKTEIPAGADHLKAIHDFSEELREAMNLTSLYNEALGTVSDRYVYDRVKDREAGPDKKKRPWDRFAGSGEKKRA
jgi:hypothetical protein